MIVKKPTQKTQPTPISAQFPRVHNRQHKTASDFYLSNGTTYAPQSRLVRWTNPSLLRGKKNRIKKRTHSPLQPYIYPYLPFFENQDLKIGSKKPEISVIFHPKKKFYLVKRKFFTPKNVPWRVPCEIPGCPMFFKMSIFDFFFS